jgi:hypothetical protein
MTCLSYLLVELTVAKLVAELLPSLLPNLLPNSLAVWLTWHARQKGLTRLPATIYGSIDMPRSNIEPESRWRKNPSS